MNKLSFDKQPEPSQTLAAAITKSASKQTYYTIRLLVDRELVADAYRAYGYFRWVDDMLDASAGSQVEKIAFADRQQALLEACYRGETVRARCAEEQILVDLVHHDTRTNDGLQCYLRNMMAVMLFDVRRRGQLITQAELSEYSRALATAVTEAMHYFIGHCDPSPERPARYLAVTAAHVTHMLRDTIEDIGDGYFNIPSEYLQRHKVSVYDVNGWAYREWVYKRVELAREHFRAGRECLAQVANLRCRLAGYAYTARFEWMLQAIARDQYCLRSDYPERKSVPAMLWIGGRTLVGMLRSFWKKTASHSRTTKPVRIEER